jgi:hypothetical protein
MQVLSLRPWCRGALAGALARPDAVELTLRMFDYSSGREFIEAHHFCGCAPQPHGHGYVSPGQ